MKIPHLTEEIIRQRTSLASWERGWGYYESGRVKKVVYRDGLLTASVSGSAFDPYRVEILFGDEGIRYASCTCPYDWGGDCKHIVAVLLHALHHPDEIEEKPSLTALLDGLNEEQLRQVLKQLVTAHPQLIDALDAFVEAQSISTSASPTPEPQAPDIDLMLLHRQIKADLRNEVSADYGYGYSSWGESWYDEADLGTALDPGLQMVWGLLEEGRDAKARQALQVLEAMTEAWQDGVDSLDEYVIENFEDVAEEFTAELGRAWAKALLVADLNEEEREEWVERMEYLRDSMFGGDSLAIAVVAAVQGWDYPPLVAVMQGEITEKGAWEEEAPYFADDLARIRLDILAQRERYQEYLNLALAEGQFLSYLQMLVKVGRTEEALQEGLAHLTTPGDVLSLARTLTEHGDVDKAIQLARHGLGLDEQREKAPLAAWLRDLAREQGMIGLALEMAEQALALNVSLENYLAWQDIAGERWPEFKHRALQVVAQHEGHVDGKVDIFLHEGMHQEAIDAVESASWFYNIDKVIDAVKETHPEWAFQRCARRAEAIMDAGKAQKYDVAVSWLRKGRDILLSAGKRAQWEAYLAGVMAKHHRKYKLMPMLKGLQK